MDTIPSQQMPPYLEEAWKSAWNFSRTFPAAQLVWDLVLSQHERQILGGEFQNVGMNARRMWQKVRGGSDRQAAIALGIAIGTVLPAYGKAILEHFGESPVNDRTMLTTAISNGGLVLVDGLREMHWGKVLIAIDWKKADRPWCFLFELARRTQIGCTLNALTFLGHAEVNFSAMTNIRHRLVKHPDFPADLAARILSSGKKEYRLDLGNLPLRIFSEDPEGKVLELLPT